MASNIVPPFKVDVSGDIYDGNGIPVVLTLDPIEQSDFMRELCRVLNENANALCHAANGEASNEKNEICNKRWCDRR